MPDRLRVLLADDEESDRVFAQRASRNASTPHMLRAVADGQQAIDYLLGLGDFSDRAQFPLPHLLLLDLNMPRRTGFDVLLWLREENQLRNLPVVVLSASGLERDVTRAYELGANAYMIKPTGLTDFQQSFSLIVAYWHRITTTVRLAT